jgi:hypothetical protein
MSPNRHLDAHHNQPRARSAVRCNHYSERYVSSDKFIMDYCNDGTITNNIMFLKNNTKEMIIDTFIRELPTESDNYDSHPDPSLCNTVLVFSPQTN